MVVYKAPMTDSGAALTWERYADRVQEFVPEILKALVDEERPGSVDELCALALEDFEDNDEPYYDMMHFAASHVKSRGFVPSPAYGARLPAFPEFTEDLVHRATETLEMYSPDSYDITTVLGDVIMHYLGWCKGIITRHWSPDRVQAFADHLDATALSKNKCVPLIVPRETGAGVEVCEI